MAVCVSAIYIGKYLHFTQLPLESAQHCGTWREEAPSVNRKLALYLLKTALHLSTVNSSTHFLRRQAGRRAQATPAQHQHTDSKCSLEEKQNKIPLFLILLKLYKTDWLFVIHELI